MRVYKSLIGKDFEGNDRGLIDVTSPGVTEESHEEIQSGLPFPRWRFEPITS
jgi:hypothetical protein